MKILHRRSAQLLIALCFTAFTVGCGDSPGADTGDNTENDGEVAECDPEEVYSDDDGQCIEDANGNDENDDNDDDNQDEPQGPEDCTDDQLFDYEDQECVAVAPGCGFGSLVGQVCPGGEAGALFEVEIEGEDCHGDSFSLTTLTDHEGHFQLDDIPAGHQLVSFIAGSFTVHETTSITHGETAETMPPDTACEVPTVSVAVIKGEYDDFSSSFASLAGPEHDDIGPDPAELSQFLGQAELIDDYDAIFVESGAPWTELAADDSSELDEIAQNLRNFVDDGNLLFASDRAHPYIQESFPEAIEFYRENEGLSQAQVGTEQTVAADILESRLGIFLKITAGPVMIDFARADWVVAESVAAESNVYIDGDVSIADSTTISYAPLLASYRNPDDQGRVIFSSFVLDDQSWNVDTLIEYLVYER